MLRRKIHRVEEGTPASPARRDEPPGGLSEPDYGVTAPLALGL